jgi:hypothetical protein
MRLRVRARITARLFQETRGGECGADTRVCRLDTRVESRAGHRKSAEMSLRTPDLDGGIRQFEETQMSRNVARPLNERHVE